MVLIHQIEKDYYTYYYLFVDFLFQNHAHSILVQLILSENRVSQQLMERLLNSRLSTKCFSKILFGFTAGILARIQCFF